MYPDINPLTPDQPFFDRLEKKYIARKKLENSKKAYLVGKKG